jgi:hypothetical protein
MHSAEVPNLDKEAERLVKEVKKDLYALGIQVRQNRNPKLSKSYRELCVALE